MDYVKHSAFHHEKLDGKKVAVWESGNMLTFDFRVGKVRSDGFHELFLTSMNSVSLPNSENKATGVLLEPPKSISVPIEFPINQDRVNKIVAPEPNSILESMGVAFAIAENSESEFFVKAKTRRPT